MKFKRIFMVLPVVLLVLLAAAACDHGLGPKDPQGDSGTGISGTLYFTNWPTPDSLFDLRMVAFKNYPPGNILTEILNGFAFFYPSFEDSLPYYVDSIEYVFELEPSEYRYITVALQFGPNASLDWLSVGQYDQTPQDSIPTAVVVEKGVMKTGIDIYVDFHHLP